MSDAYPLVRRRWNAFAVTPTNSGVSRNSTSKVTSPEMRSSPANRRPRTFSGGVSRRSNVNSIGPKARRTSGADLIGAGRWPFPIRWRIPPSVRARATPTGSAARPSLSAISPAPRIRTTGPPERHSLEYTAVLGDNTLVTGTCWGLIAKGSGGGA